MPLEAAVQSPPALAGFLLPFQHPEDLNQLSLVTGISLRIPTYLLLLEKHFTGT